jgi:hypothetical protein
VPWLTRTAPQHRVTAAPSDIHRVPTPPDAMFTASTFIVEWYSVRALVARTPPRASL